MVTQDVENTIVGLERRGWDSLCIGTGAEFYGSLMTPDALMVLADGLALDRDGVIASLTDALTWDGYELSDERFIAAGRDAVVISYTGRARRGNEPEFVARMATTYVQHEGQWRLALYQQTPLPQQAPLPDQV